MCIFLVLWVESRKLQIYKMCEHMSEDGFIIEIMTSEHGSLSWLRTPLHANKEARFVPAMSLVGAAYSNAILTPQIFNPPTCIDIV